MAKVSVIPTYNRAEYLYRAVMSVMAQTCPDWEMLIVDDASQDGTQDVVLRIGNPRVHYFRHETNRGVSAARNTALAQASGEFVAFLDDDDEWLPEKLAIQLEFFERAGMNVGLLCSGHYVATDGVDLVAPDIMSGMRGRVYERVLSQGYFHHTSTVIARAECFDRVGVFDLKFRYAEDLDMWLRIATEYEVDFVPIPLVRRHLLADGFNQNYEAIISGTETHLSKYREFYQRNPDVLKQQLHKLAVCYCVAGQVKRGRQTFYRAISLGQVPVKSYVCIVLSLFGSHLFRSCLTARGMLRRFFVVTALLTSV